MVYPLKVSSFDLVRNKIELSAEQSFIYKKYGHEIFTSSFQMNLLKPLNTITFFVHFSVIGLSESIVYHLPSSASSFSSIVK